MKKIMILTGTRADYGKIKSVIKRIEKSNDFEVYIYVTGMHLKEKYGSTYLEIEKDGFKNIFLSKPIQENLTMDVALAENVIQISEYVKKINPDLILVHGDRLEAMAGSIVGAFNNIYVAHIEGGEVSGTIDESIRHAISKLSHFHFVSNENAKKRLIQMGENKKHIHIVGSPDIDIMLSDKLPDLKSVKDYYGIDFDNYAILMYHPVTTELENIRNNIKTIIKTLKSSGDNYVVIYPNNDMGTEIIMEEYNELLNNNKFKFYPSLSFERFLTLLKNAKYIIGNSSAGIMESGVYGIPAINIGTRQRGRYDKDKVLNIQTVDYEEKDILEAIKNIEDHRKVSFFYGEGKSSELIFELLSKEEFWQNDVQKVFYELD